MVNLHSIKPDPHQGKDLPARRASIVPGLEHISLEAPGEDEFSTSVYGSSFAAQDLPDHEMPEKEMPKEIAYRMIKDELSLDGNPMLKSVCSIQIRTQADHSSVALPASSPPLWYLLLPCPPATIAADTITRKTKQKNS